MSEVTDAVANAAVTGTAAPESGDTRADGASHTKPEPVRLPSSKADYLNNLPPDYPAISRRLGEQGKVVIHVLIGKDGSAKEAEIAQSSGFERLDQAALRTVLNWRYVPGSQDGQPQDMWFNAPIIFKLN